jgi:hypothetical protein
MKTVLAFLTRAFHTMKALQKDSDAGPRPDQYRGKGRGPFTANRRAQVKVSRIRKLRATGRKPR